MLSEGELCFLSEGANSEKVTLSTQTARIFYIIFILLSSVFNAFFATAWAAGFLFVRPRAKTLYLAVKTAPFDYLVFTSFKRRTVLFIA